MHDRGGEASLHPRSPAPLRSAGFRVDLLSSVNEFLDAGRRENLAARMTMLPVICAVNRPPSARKPMTCTLPATMLSTKGSCLLAR
jgi:hypothetical protein